MHLFYFILLRCDIYSERIMKTSPSPSSCRVQTIHTSRQKGQTKRKNVQVKGTWTRGGERMGDGVKVNISSYTWSTHSFFSSTFSSIYYMYTHMLRHDAVVNASAAKGQVVIEGGLGGGANRIRGLTVQGGGREG